MSRFSLHLGIAITSVIGMASVAPAVKAQSTVAQPSSNTVFLDVVVPLTFRDLDPAIVEVFTDCVVWVADKLLMPSNQTLFGETRVGNMTKSITGSYSVTLRTRMEVATQAAGASGKYWCRAKGKAMNGVVKYLDATPSTVPPFKLAPGSHGMVIGNFTW